VDKSGNRPTNAISGERGVRRAIAFFGASGHLRTTTTSANVRGDKNSMPGPANRQGPWLAPSLGPHQQCLPHSWVISGTSVTVESGQRFLHGFVTFEGSFKKLVGMTLAKVWANFARGQNSKWLSAAILEITVSIIWPTALISICSLGFSGARNSFLAFS